MDGILRDFNDGLLIFSVVIVVVARTVEGRWSDVAIGNSIGSSKSGINALSTLQLFDSCGISIRVEGTSENEVMR